MEFDRRKILTIATCEQAQVGQFGWFGDDGTPCGVEEEKDQGFPGLKSLYG